MMRSSSGTLTAVAAVAIILVATVAATADNHKQINEQTVDPGYESPEEFENNDARYFDPNVDAHDHMHYDIWTLEEDGPQDLIDYLYNYDNPNAGLRHQQTEDEEYYNDPEYIPGMPTYDDDYIYDRIVNSAERIESEEQIVNKRMDLLDIFQTGNHNTETESSKSTEENNTPTENKPTTENNTTTEKSTPSEYYTTTGCSCGIAKSSRILGGKDVDIPQKYPWAVLVKLIKNHGTQQTCGGSIIGDRWVLTAAHCVVVKSRCSSLKGCKFPSRQCYLSRKTQKTFTQVTIEEHQIKVFKEYLHPKFDNCKSMHNDFALLKLEESITFTDHLMPVCLPTNNINTFGCKSATVIGWGKYEYNSYSTSTTLKEHDTQILERPWCGLWNKDGDMDQSQLCAGGQVAGEGFCHGDHGGALMVSDAAGDHHTLVGIASKVYENCGHKYWPDVYARVTEAMPWINTIANGTFCTAPNKE